MESVPYGTVFLTAGQHYIDGGSFYSPMDLNRSLEAFVDDLSSGSDVRITHSSKELVDQLVKKHGLVIVHKSSSMTKPASKTLKLDGTDYVYQINGVDGDFDFNQIRSYVTRGVIKFDTGIRVLDAEYKQLSDYVPASKISSIRPLFSTLVEPPSEIADAKPSVVIVAANPASVRALKGQIENYFDIQPEDAVLYGQSLDQVAGDRGVVKTFKDIEKQPKRA